jgi:uncharacterized protein (TIGR03067 family)
MHVRLISLVTLGLLLACSGRSLWAADQATERETKKLQGTWEIVSQEMDGTVMPKSHFEDTRVLFKGEAFKTEVKGKVVAEGTWKLVGVRGKVIEVDEITAASGRNVAGTTPAIYEWVNENTFRWCQPVEKGSRPTEFTARKGSRQEMLEYRRVGR